MDRAEATLQSVSRRSVRRVIALGRRFAVLLAGCVAALIVTEIGARCVNARTGGSSDPKAAARRLSPHVSANSLGFREREIGPKRPDRYRLAVIGDSYTWGAALEEPERFSNVLELLLGPHYEVLNFGIPGHTMPNHLDELDLVLKLSPDFVLLQLYINNFETSSMKRPKPRPLLPRQIEGGLVESSVVYPMLNDRFAQFQEAVGLVDSYDGYMARHLRDPESPDARESFGRLRQFFDRAQAAGVSSGAVLFPAADAMGPFGANYPFGFLHDHVKAVCVDAHVPCLDLLPSFASLPDPRTTWVNPFDAHPNARTNRRAALEMLGTFGSTWRHGRDRPPQN
jgi:hypothetical protein